jgi:tetratricopeptide (TPR) repeat protein
MFEHAAKLDPDNPSVPEVLGNVQYAQGNLDAAITAYNRAIKLVPFYTAARHYLALAYEGKMYTDPAHTAKWRSKALEAWQKTYELAPQDPAFSADYILMIGQHIQELKALTV